MEVQAINTNESISKPVTQKTYKNNGIVYSKPTLTKKEVQSVMECLVTDHIAFGSIAENFEKEAAKSFDFKKSLSVISYTSAYHLSFLSLEIEKEKEDEVIISANAPVEILDALGYLDIEPIIVDVARDGFLPSSEQIIEQITDKTKCIVLNYSFGAFYDYEELREYIEEKNKLKNKNEKIKIIEDLSFIIGHEHKGRFIGADADIAIVGMNKDMIMTIGKGALLLTDSTKYYATAKDLRMQKSSKTYRIRYDYTITDMNAAIGLEQLGQLSSILDRRRKIGVSYKEALKTSKIESYFNSAGLDSFGAFPIVVNTSQKHALKYFQSLRIEVKKVQEPLHHFLDLPNGDFINAEKLYNKGLLIPIYPYLTKKNIERMIGSLRAFY